jgi:hypothetical protein
LTKRNTVPSAANMRRTLLISRKTGKVPRAKINFGDNRVYQDLLASFNASI